MNCGLLTSITNPKEWRIQFEPLVSVDDVGHGWQIFLVDQKVTARALLVFEVVDDHCLVVIVYHPNSPWKVKVVLEVPSKPYLDRLHFEKTMRASHLRTDFAMRMVSFPFSPS